MKEPLDTDRFLVDERYGHSYHTLDCEIISMVVSPLANYVELPYSEIKNLETNSGGKFEPHECVKMASWITMRPIISDMPKGDK